MIDSKLVSQKGLGCLRWIYAMRVTGQPLQPGFAGGLYFRFTISLILEDGGTILPLFWRDAGMLAPHIILLRKGVEIH